MPSLTIVEESDASYVILCSLYQNKRHCCSGLPMFTIPSSTELQDTSRICSGENFYWLLFSTISLVAGDGYKEAHRPSIIDNVKYYLTKLQVGSNQRERIQKNIH